MFERINFFFKVHFKKHIALYGVVVFIFLIGITSGAFTVNAIPSNQKGGLADYINALANSTIKGGGNNIDKTAILLEGLRQYCGFAFIAWFFGLSYIGIPVIVIACGIRGFLLGFTTGFLVSFYGIRGVFFIIIYILPQNLIYIPCIIIITIISLENAIKNYRQRKASLSRQFGNKDFISYTIKMFIITMILIVGILYEAFITPFLLDIFSNIINKS